MAARRAALTADDVFLSKLELTRTLFFRSALDVDRLEASLRYALESFPSLSGCLTQRGGHLFVSYGGAHFAPLTVRRARFDGSHWERPAPAESGRVILRPEQYRAWLFLRTFGRALGAYGALLWPRPVMHVELLRASCAADAAAGAGDYLTVAINHAVADGYVFERFLRSLAAAYNGEPLLAPGAPAAAAAAAARNRALVRRALALRAPVLIDLVRRQPAGILGFFQFQLRLSPGIMDGLRRRYAGPAGRPGDSDVVLTAVWDAKRRSVAPSPRHGRADVCVAFHRNVRSYVSGLEAVQGNLFMSSRAVCPARSDVPDSELEGGRVAEAVARLRRALVHTIDDVVDGMEETRRRGGEEEDAEAPRAVPSLIPITRIPELIDPARTDVVYAAGAAPEADAPPLIPPLVPPERPPRALVHMNDLSHQQSRFVFADDGAVVGAESAHPERFDDAAGGSCASSWGDFEAQLLEHIGHIPIWFCRLMPDARVAAGPEPAGLILLVSAGNGLVNP